MAYVIGGVIVLLAIGAVLWRMDWSRRPDDDTKGPWPD